MKNNFIKLFLFLYLYPPCYLSGSIHEMTLEEKIGQLLIVQFRGDILTEEAISLVKNLHVSGFIYYKWANDLSRLDTIKRLSKSFQMLAKSTPNHIPLFICTDQEGGGVNRLGTQFPGNRALSITDDLTLTKYSAYLTAKELKAVGVNMNLSPVVDINTNPKNPVIGIRSFGGCPYKVTEFAKATLDGYHLAGMITTLKHFPGHGDVDIDSHEELPVLKKTKEELKECELIPFSKLAKDTDMIMTAHISFPLIDPDCLATFSKKILNILRDEIHFDKVIISDSIGMKGCLRQCTSKGEAAIFAINAGCDLLILGGEEISHKDLFEIYYSLLKAVQNNVISMDRIDESVSRILRLKEKYDLFSEKEISIDLKKHQQLAKEIAKKGIIIIKNKQIDSPLEQSLTIYAPARYFEKVKTTYLQEKVLSYGEEILKNNIDLLLKKGHVSDLLVVFLADTYQTKIEANFVRSLLKLNKPVVLVALKNPIDAAPFSKADVIIYTHSPSDASIEATYDIINSL